MPSDYIRREDAVRAVGRIRSVYTGEEMWNRAVDAAEHKISALPADPLVLQGGLMPTYDPDGREERNDAIQGAKALEAVKRGIDEMVAIHGPGAKLIVLMGNEVYRLYIDATKRAYGSSRPLMRLDDRLEFCGVPVFHSPFIEAEAAYVMVEAWRLRT